ncbi:MAG: protease pro-enzyme activation domain-containing protein [Candidatus Binataceae bacterium]
MLIVALAVPLCLYVAGCSALGGGSSGGGAEQNGVRLPKGHPTNVDLSFDHPAPGDRVIQMEVNFAKRDKAQFDELMRAIQDPKSPEYHHWLTPQEIHARFGETQSQFDAVEQWLVSQGFTIISKGYGTNSDYIAFKGTIKQAENAFNVEIVAPEYDLYANKQDPMIPAQFAGVISYVTGLNDIEGL